MDGQSDKSSVTSDSGGLIDLSGVSATGSGTPSSKNGNSSLENSKEGSGMKSGGDGSRGGLKKRVHRPSEEIWLADMDAEMNGVKLIGEEEFDFDIPEEYLNISFEPVHPDSLEENQGGTAAGETAEGPTVSSPEGDQNCQTQDESFQLLGAMMNPVREHNGVTAETVSDQQTGNLLFPMGEQRQCLVLEAEGCVEPCLLDDESRRKSSSTDSGVSGMSTQGFNFEEESEKAAATGLLGTQKKHTAPRDLISFTPWTVESQENAGEGEAAAGMSEGASPTLGSAAFRGDVPGDQGSNENKSSPQMAKSIGRDGAEKVLSDGESGGRAAEGESSSSKQNRSRLPTPKKQLRKCSVFNSSPVKCSQLEELKFVSKEGDSLLHHLASETIIVTGSIAATTVGSTAMPSSSSCETFIISDSSANRGGEREMVGSENLNDSTSSIQSQASTASQGSASGAGLASRPARKTGAIPRASSKSKLTKLGSKPSLLPSKPTSALPKVTRRPKPGTLANVKGSQLPKPPQGFKSPSVRRDNPAKPRMADDGKGRAANRLKPVRATGMAVRPTAKTGNKLISRLPAKVIGQRQQSSQTVPKSTLTPRRNSNPTTLPACNPLRGQPTTSKVSLSTSIVSTGSPSVQQSTPIKTAAKATPKRKAVPLTPKAPMDTTPEMPRATFSFSSIEGGSSCMKQPAARLPIVSDTNETFKVENKGPPGLQTPQSSKKKRRSFIPTPGGQERAARMKISSPILYDMNTLMATKEDGGGTMDTRGTSPMLSDPSLTKRSMQMPPPKARKVLNPRTRPSGLQRLRGGRPQRVFAVRQPTVGGSRQEGPLKAKRAFAYGRDTDFDDYEFPIPRAKVVHSPLGQENQPTTPHSEWSPIRKKKPISLEDECIQCTKKGRL